MFLNAKLATVMSHEGSHYNGNRVEGLVHLAGAETYSQLNEMFKLQADTSFSMEMLSGIMNAESWKENTSSSDYWRVHEDGTVTWDGQLNFYKDGETDKNNANAGKLLDYRNLDEVIENVNKDGLTTVMLGGIEVDVERLKEISAINKELILASRSSNTYASKALINDGFKYFGTDGTGKNHKYKDVIPYWKWGNTPEDMTSNKARIHPVLEYFYPSYTSNLERYNAHH